MVVVLSLLQHGEVATTCLICQVRVQVHGSKDIAHIQWLQAVCLVHPGCKELAGKAGIVEVSRVLPSSAWLVMQVMAASCGVLALQLAFGHKQVRHGRALSALQRHCPCSTWLGQGPVTTARRPRMSGVIAVAMDLHLCRGTCLEGCTMAPKGVNC